MQENMQRESKSVETTSTRNDKKCIKCRNDKKNAEMIKKMHATSSVKYFPPYEKMHAAR